MAMRSWLAGLAAMFFLSSGLCGRAAAVVPEAGFYFSGVQPGLGYYIEVQNGVVGFAAYAYEGNGEPVFYTGAGPLREVFEPGDYVEGPVYNDAGFYPWHAVRIQLFRSTGGACMPCSNQGQLNITTYAGSVYLRSFEQDNMLMDITWADGRTVDLRIIQRLLFGFGPVVGPRSEGSVPILRDLRGDWVFVDKNDMSKPALRFNLTRKQGGAFPTQSRPWTISFFDDVQTAEFRCTANNTGVVSSGKYSGCEMYKDGELLFWAQMSDLGHSRIVASYGPILTQGQGYRGPGKIIGTRVD